MVQPGDPKVDFVTAVKVGAGDEDLVVLESDGTDQVRIVKRHPAIAVEGIIERPVLVEPFTATFSRQVASFRGAKDQNFPVALHRDCERFTKGAAAQMGRRKALASAVCPTPARAIN